MSNENPPQGQGQNEERGSSRIFDWFFSRGVTIPILVFALLILAGLLLFGIHPWYVLQGAVESYRQAQLKDAIVEHHVELGNSFLNVGRPEAAAAEYEEALKVAPTNARVQLSVRKSELYRQIRDREYDGATMQDRLTRLEEVSPNDFTGDFSDIHLSHLRTLEGDISRDPGKAEGLYQEATSLNPKNSYAFAALSIVYDQQGRPEEALEMAEKAYNMADQHPEYQNNRAFVLYENKRYEDSIVAYTKILDEDPEFLTPYFELPIVYRVVGDVRIARDLQTGFIEQFLEDEEQAKELAKLEKNKGILFYPTQSGRPVYLSKDPEKKYYAYYSAALTSYLLGDEEEAEERVNQARGVSVPTTSKAEVKRLMEHDVQTLQEQDRFRAKADNFQEEFLDQEETAPVAAAGGKTETKASKAEVKAGGAQVKTLPSTGGADIAALLGLGAAALLVGGVLLAHRIIR